MTAVDLLAWWYPVFAWAVAIAAVTATLLGVFGVGGRDASSRPLRGLPVACGLLALVPIGGLPLGRWLLGITGPFSVPLVAVMVDRVAGFVGRPLLDERSRWTAAWFALASSLAVYPAALGLGRFDPYVLGWTTPGVTAVAAVLGAGLMATGNRFGGVLLAAGLLWQLGTLESANGWDYLVDPIAGVVAAGTLAGEGLKRAFHRMFSGRVGGDAAEVARPQNNSRRQRI